MRGCRCAMSMKAERKSLPSLSSSRALCRAVRAGQVSTRKKMTKATTAMISAMSANAAGQSTCPDLADFDIGVGRWALSVERFSFAQAVIEQEHGHRQEQEERGQTSSAKNYRPPRPIGREGRLFPPEQS